MSSREVSTETGQVQPPAFPDARMDPSNRPSLETSSRFAAATRDDEQCSRWTQILSTGSDAPI